MLDLFCRRSTKTLKTDVPSDPVLLDPPPSEPEYCSFTWLGVPRCDFVLLRGLYRISRSLDSQYFSLRPDSPHLPGHLRWYFGGLSLPVRDSLFLLFCVCVCFVVVVRERFGFKVLCISLDYESLSVVLDVSRVFK